MRGFAEEKIEGGKLVKIKVEYDSKVRFIQILGDFFVHPEEGIELIEKVLVGIPVNESEEQISEEIKEVVQNEKIQLIGITPQAIASVLKKAMTR